MEWVGLERIMEVAHHSAEALQHLLHHLHGLEVCKVPFAWGGRPSQVAERKKIRA